jgi:hypothetical protein
MTPIAWFSDEHRVVAEHRRPGGATNDEDADDVDDAESRH